MPFEQVSQSLLLPGGIGESELQMALTEVAKQQIDYADLYFQHSRHESWVLEDGIVKEGSYNIEQGLGVRAISGEQTGFAYSDVIDNQALLRTCQAARGISPNPGRALVKPFKKVTAEQFYQSDNPLVSLSNQQKIALLERADKYARSLDPAVTQVIVSLSGVYEEVLVAASDGTLAADIRPLIRFNCSVLVERNQRRERGSAGGGGRRNYSYFLEEVSGRERAMGFVDEAVRQALVNLEAIDAPAGLMPVVLGAGWPGYYYMKRLGMAWKATLTVRALLPLAAALANK